MTLIYPILLLALPACILVLIMKKNSARRIYFFSHPSAFLGLKNKKASLFLGFVISLQVLILCVFLILLASPAKVIKKTLNPSPKNAHLLLDYNTLYTLSKPHQDDFKNTILKAFVKHIKPNAICLWAISDTMRPALPCSPNYYALLKQIDNLTFYSRPESLSLEDLYQTLKEKQLLNPKHTLTYISPNAKNTAFFSQNKD